MRFIIVHGAMSGSHENWFPYIKHELERLGNEVIVPDFPTPQGQNLDLWLNALKKKAGNIDEETILIGHSVGCAFILSVLERQKRPVKACFFVGGFVGALGIDLDKVNKNLAERDFNWVKIRADCQKFVLFVSDNDPFVPVSKGAELSQKLGVGAELVMVNGAGHFNTSSGYTKFPMLLEKIIGLVK